MLTDLRITEKESGWSYSWAALYWYSEPEYGGYFESYKYLISIFGEDAVNEWCVMKKKELVLTAEQFRIFIELYAIENISYSYTGKRNAIEFPVVNILGNGRIIDMFKSSHDKHIRLE